MTRAADLIRLDPAQLVAEARQLLADGEPAMARLAAAMAARPETECPFSDPHLVEGWRKGLTVRAATQRTIRGVLGAAHVRGPGHAGAARAIKDEGEDTP